MVSATVPKPRPRPKRRGKTPYRDRAAYLADYWASRLGPGVKGIACYLAADLLARWRAQVAREGLPQYAVLIRAIRAYLAAMEREAASKPTAPPRPTPAPTTPTSETWEEF